MQKFIFVVLLLITSIVSASSVTAEEKIYSSVIDALYGKERVVKVWSDDLQKKDILKKIKHIKLVDSTKEADVLFVYHTANLQSDKPKFVGSYALLKSYKKEAIGGFYWQKGRPNLLFLEENLAKKHLRLPTEFSKYIDKRF